MYNTPSVASAQRFDRYAGKGFVGLAFAILLVSGVALAFLWDSLPERWAIHWGVNGQPNGWSTRTPAGVFLPIGIGLLMCAILEGAVALSRWKIQRGSAWKVSGAAAQALAQITAGFIRLIEVALAGVFGSLALVLPLGSPLRHDKLMLLTFIWFASLVVIGCRRMMKGAAEMKVAGLTSGVEGWNGLIYRNANDPRLWVPKITGVGYTLNFARPAARWIMAALLAIPLFAVAVVFLSSM